MADLPYNDAQTPMATRMLYSNVSPAITIGDTY